MIADICREMIEAGLLAKCTSEADTDAAPSHRNSRRNSYRVIRHTVAAMEAWHEDYGYKVR